MTVSRGLPVSGVVPPVLSLLAITAAVIAAFRRVIFEGLALSGYDIQTYFFPMRAYAAETLLGGGFPLWNPYLFMGAPFFANPQTAVIYPVNLALLPLDAIWAVTATVIIHVWLGAVGTALFARRALGCGWPAATIAAIAFGLGGFLSGQSGHPNQIAVLAWLPFGLLLISSLVERPRLWPALGLAGVLALQLSAGHPQQVYISLTLTGAYFAFALLYRRRVSGRGRRRAALTAIGLFVLAVTLGLGISAVQLMPTILLSSLSIRAGGLALYESGSFSLPLESLGTALFPSFTYAPTSQEFLGYAGFTGLWLAALGMRAARRQAHAGFFVAVAAIALLLAVGPATPFFKAAHAFVPGFDLFRVPARWLGAVSFALACLAGLGADGLLRTRITTSKAAWATWSVAGALMAGIAATSLRSDQSLPSSLPLIWAAAGVSALIFLAGARRWPRPWAALAPAALAAELVFAQAPLELAKPIPPEAYIGEGQVIPRLPFGADAPRTLGLADPSFEVNDRDRNQLAAQHRGNLGGSTFVQFLVGLKYRDILSPNLPLAYLRPSPDGYDGGVLPLRDYVTLKGALIPGASDQEDAILRNQLEGIPAGRVLDVLGVGYVLADRKQDLGLDGVFFDTEAALEIPPQGEAVVGLARAVPVAEAAMIGTIVVESAGQMPVRAGWLELLEGDRAVVALPIRPGAVVEAGREFEAVIGRPIESAGGTAPRASRSRLAAPMQVTGLRLRAEPGVKLAIKAITLIDPAGELTPVTLLTDQVVELLYWTDVKIYKLAGPAPRAWLVHTFGIADTVEQAAQTIQSAGFEPRRYAVLERAGAADVPARPVLGWFGDRLRDLGARAPRGRFGAIEPAALAGLLQIAALESDAALRVPSYSLGPTPPAQPAEIVSYEPDRVTVKTQSDGSALLILGDAIYPGWRARIDGSDAPLWRANLLFRAVLVPAGEHVVEFAYRPRELETGLAVSAVTAVIMVGLAAAPAIRAVRRKLAA